MRVRWSLSAANDRRRSSPRANSPDFAQRTSCSTSRRLLQNKPKLNYQLRLIFVLLVKACALFVYAQCFSYIRYKIFSRSVVTRRFRKRKPIFFASSKL